jgi:hypothetical protein
MSPTLLIVVRNTDEGPDRPGAARADAGRRGVSEEPWKLRITRMLGLSSGD